MNDAHAEARLPREAREAQAVALIDLSDLPVIAREHFKLCWFGALIQVVHAATAALGSSQELAQEFPFLDEYRVQLVDRGLDWRDARAARRWWASIERWEAGGKKHLPLRALRLGIAQGWNAVGALLTLGLSEDDPRFGALFSRMQGGTLRTPTVGFLNACWSDGQTAPTRRLQEWGLLQVTAGDGGRHTATVRVPSWVWDAIAEGETRASGPGWVYEPAASFGNARPALVLSEETERAVCALPELVRAGTLDTVVVRGPRASGRSRLLGELAPALGRGLLTFSPALKPDDERWSLLGPLATLLGAMPVVEFELSAGETWRVPELGDYPRPLAVILGRRGGLAGTGAARAVTLELGVPSQQHRLALWKALMPEADAELCEALAARYRTPAGRLVQLAGQATARAALACAARPVLADFAAAARALHSEEIGSLATLLPRGGSWDELALPPEMMNELRAVELRCRYRERLASEGDRFAPNAGVRALFTGPSGTGKTLAARVLGEALGRDVYRVDLAAVINKYIGETEKNLDRVLSLAEELDVVLLFDEGDALLARRTTVQSANDRYANLETNFLLQRLESFDGIVFITTNAGERIDSAFQRRMDAVVEFRMPDMAERRRLWKLHLPEESEVDTALLDRLAGQCVLNGGQIRNVALHARLLAIDYGGALKDEHLAASLRREYRRLGAQCPVRLP